MSEIINDAMLIGEAGNPENPAAGLPRVEPMRGHEVVDEVWEEKSDKEANITPCTSISFAAGETLELCPCQVKVLKINQEPFVSNLPFLTFESSDPSVVHIIEDCVAYACCEGEATITASSSDGSNLEASIKVVVKQKEQQSEEEGGGDEKPEEGKGEFISPVLPEHVYVGEEYEVSVGFKSDSNISGVKFIATTTGPGDVTYTLSDGQGNEFSFVNNVEWGGSGFDIVGTPENPYEAYTPVKASFSVAGTYEFRTQLVKASSGEVVNEDVATITVEDKSEEGNGRSSKRK